MDLTELDLAIIRKMADCDLNIADVGRSLYLHRNTVAYHLGQIKKKTGLDPAKFYDLVELLEMVGSGMKGNV